MNRFFIELVLDEDVHALLADLIRSRGFTATTARESGLLGQSDRVVLEYAITNERALLTHNRVDFEKLATEYAEIGRTHYGIILAVRRTPQEMRDRLLPLLNQTTADEMIDQLRYI